MPGIEKGPRLYLRPASRRGDGYLRKAQWLILDRGRQRGTGCGADNRREAEAKLAAYIAEEHVTEAASAGPRHINCIPVADPMAAYLSAVAAKKARPHEAAARAERLLAFMGDRMLSDINGDLCRGYARHRGSEAAARRELEDLRAAINHYHREGLCHELVGITLPDRSPGRERWLTRSEAARLIWAAWRYREKQNWRSTERYTRRHIARFILVALYTGTRPGAVTAAALQPTDGHGWIDVERGIYYRRPDGAKETKKRQPAIRLGPRLLAHLRRWKRNGARYAVEWNRQPVRSIRRAFAAVVADAGLADVTPHVLRHTAVTWAMQNGADTYRAGDYFGLSRQMIEHRYGHHDPDHGRDIANAIAGRSTNGRPTIDVNGTGRSRGFVVEEPRKAAVVQ